jgi:hypothetical protein
MKNLHSWHEKISLDCERQMSDIIKQTVDNIL